VVLVVGFSFSCVVVSAGFIFGPMVVNYGVEAYNMNAKGLAGYRDVASYRNKVILHYSYPIYGPFGIARKN
jgi:hypothetical protein